MPDGCVNAAFTGNFAETPHDTVFNEYSVRTAMEAVYTLLDADSGAPKVFGFVYAILEPLNSAAKIMDSRKLSELKLPQIFDLFEHDALKGISQTRITQLLNEYGLL